MLNLIYRLRTSVVTKTYESLWVQYAFFYQEFGKDMGPPPKPATVERSGKMSEIVVLAQTIFIQSVVRGGHNTTGRPYPHVLVSFRGKSKPHAYSWYVYCEQTALSTRPREILYFEKASSTYCDVGYCQRRQMSRCTSRH